MLIGVNFGEISVPVFLLLKYFNSKLCAKDITVNLVNCRESLQKSVQHVYQFSRKVFPHRSSAMSNTVTNAGSKSIYKSDCMEKVGTFFHANATGFNSLIMHYFL